MDKTAIKSMMAVHISIQFLVMSLLFQLTRFLADVFVSPKFCLPRWQVEQLNRANQSAKWLTYIAIVALISAFIIISQTLDI